MSKTLIKLYSLIVILIEMIIKQQQPPLLLTQETMIQLSHVKKTGIQNFIAKRLSLATLEGFLLFASASLLH